MSDPTNAAKAGAQAARAKDDAVEAGLTAENQGESTWARARRRVGETTASVGDRVQDKVSDLRTREGRSDAEATAVLGGSAAGTAAGASSTVARTAATGSGATPTATTRAAAVTRRTRKARLRLSRIDPWSVMKTVFLFSIAGGIILFVATWVVWGVINASGVFDSVNTTVNELVGNQGSSNNFRLESYVNTHKVLGLTALVAAINVVLITALATLFSFLYNLAATVMGGLEVTLAED